MSLFPTTTIVLLSTAVRTMSWLSSAQRVNFKNVPTYLEEMYGTMINNVTYYNLQGTSSDKPFKGMNIVVTRYANGKVVTEKKMM